MINIQNVARIVWAGAEEKAKGEILLHEVRQRSYDLEWYAVRDGLRRANITSSEDEEMVIRRIRDMQLNYKILGRYKAYRGYSHTLQSANPGEPTCTYFAIAKTNEDAKLMAEAFKTFDNATQGELLGYPKCCSEAFDARWKWKEHDHVFQAALAQADNCSHEELCSREHMMAVCAGMQMNSSNTVHMNLSGIGHTNQFFRYSGPRLIHHLPCRFDCVESIRVAKEYENLERHIFGDTKLYTFLNQPFTASLYRGIVEVTTNSFRIISATDFTATKYIIKVS